MLDVNARTHSPTSPGILAEAIRIVNRWSTFRFASLAIVKALESGLAAYQGKALGQLGGRPKRSVSTSFLPLVKKHGRRRDWHRQRRDRHFEDPDVRFESRKKIVLRAESYGSPART